MKTTSRTSRRTFVLSGTAAAVCLGPLAVSQFAEASGSGAKVSTRRSEIAEWEALVGTAFLVGGEGGKVLARLAAIAQPPLDPKRPTALARFQPFTAYFELDARVAPAGQKSYRVTHPAKGTIDLFLSRGATRQGKAVLLALFN